ncbi:MAG: hypothetical protein HND53_06885 [Proteobacteria bacterium]|nr:hypothetical protein [Pseudomonadota bacterium]NOG60210.1 hypothetical protein [Pseudomonadota bacterium]
MVDRTVISINTAINYEAAFAVMRKDTDSIKKLMIMNPIDLMTNQLTLDDVDLLDSLSLDLSNAKYLASAPANYSGTVIDDSDPLLESGKWYFDQDDQFLFYKLNNSEFFSSDIDGPARIRFKINLKYEDVDSDSSFNLLVDKFDSMQLQSIDHYEWSF